MTDPIRALLLEMADELDHSRQCLLGDRRIAHPLADRARAALAAEPPAPVPVPVAERPWERPGWCDAEGRCWIATPEAEYLYASWALEPPPSDSALRRMQHVISLPHWAIPVPQPPQGGKVEP